MFIDIVVKFEFEAWHKWPKAPREHLYLSFPHRHMFHVHAQKTVEHADREIEIIKLKRELYNACKAKYGLASFDSFEDGTTVDYNDCTTDSCEQMALWLLQRFGLSFAQVLEDGENGACVQPNPYDVVVSGCLEDNETIETPSGKEFPVDTVVQRFSGNMFWGTEAEGPHYGIRTLFVPSEKINLDLFEFIETIPTKEHWEYRHLYLGADNSRVTHLESTIKFMQGREELLRGRFTKVIIETDYRSVRPRAKLRSEDRLGLVVVALYEDEEEQSFPPEARKERPRVTSCDFLKRVQGEYIEWVCTHTGRLFRTRTDDPAFGNDEPVDLSAIWDS